MRKILIVVFALFATTTFGQQLNNFKQEEGWYDFKSLRSQKTRLTEFANNFKTELGLTPQEILSEKRKEKDNLGRTHIFYKHILNGIEVEYSELILHSTIDNEYTEVVNEKLAKNLLNQNPVVSEAEALTAALSKFSSTKYAWQDSLEQAELLFKKLYDWGEEIKRQLLIFLTCPLMSTT